MKGKEFFFCLLFILIDSKKFKGNSFSSGVHTLQYVFDSICQEFKTKCLIVSHHHICND